MTFIYPILLGVIAYVYIHIILAPGMLMGRFADFVWSRIINNNKNKELLIWQPFFECSRCFAGQLGMWGYVGLSFYQCWWLCDYNLVIHIYWICVAILVAYIIEVTVMKIHYDKKIKELKDFKNKINHENKTHLSKRQGGQD